MSRSKAMNKLVALLAALVLSVVVTTSGYAQAQSPKGAEGPDIRKQEPKGAEGPGVRKAKKKTAATSPNRPEGPDVRRGKPDHPEGPDVRKAKKKPTASVKSKATDRPEGPDVRAKVPPKGQEGPGIPKSEEKKAQ
jgi:hypothetical protein